MCGQFDILKVYQFRYDTNVVIAKLKFLNHVVRLVSPTSVGFFLSANPESTVAATRSLAACH